MYTNCLEAHSNTSANSVMRKETLGMGMVGSWGGVYKQFMSMIFSLSCQKIIQVIRMMG